MLLKVVFCLIVYINSLEARAQEYQYMGVKNVNQMEPPSLESMGSLEGQYQHNQENGGSAMMDQGGHQGGQARYMGAGAGAGGQAGAGRSMDGKKDCNKNDPNAGWRPADPNDRPMMRSLTGKPCKGGKGRSFDPDQTPNVKPDIRMVDRKKEESPLQEVSRINLRPQEDRAEEKDLKPNVHEKIESYTETYIASSVATRIITRKRIFMQKRKIVNQKINKPIVIIRRKVIKERQIFERIIPKIIETREIINNPIVKSKVVEGPIYEVPVPQAEPQMNPNMRNLNEEDCPEVAFDPNSGETVDGAQAVYGGNTGYGYLG